MFYNSIFLHGFKIYLTHLYVNYYVIYKCIWRIMDKNVPTIFNAK